MSRDRSGSAFPHGVVHTGENSYGEDYVREYDEPGLSIMDFFAAKALLTPEVARIRAEFGVDAAADEAYAMAAAMVRRREQ